MLNSLAIIELNNERNRNTFVFGENNANQWTFRAIWREHFYLSVEKKIGDRNLLGVVAEMTTFSIVLPSVSSILFSFCLFPTLVFFVLALFLPFEPNKTYHHGLWGQPGSWKNAIKLLFRLLSTNGTNKTLSGHSNSDMKSRISTERRNKAMQLSFPSYLVLKNSYWKTHDEFKARWLQFHVKRCSRGTIWVICQLENSFRTVWIRVLLVIASSYLNKL